MMTSPALELGDLTVTYPGAARSVHALRGVSLRLDEGAAVGVVGESGSGKTSLALATSLLLPPETRVTGSVRVGGRELVGARTSTLREIRWREIACVVQAPGRGFTPVRRVGQQIAETLRLRRGMSRAGARGRLEALAEQVHLDPGLLARYPHQLSGGQQQRAMLAMALSCEPRVLVLDEPTSGLDATTKQALLATLRRVREDTGVTLLVSTHDVPAAAKLTDELAVLYGGLVLEQGSTQAVLADPRHPYTRDVLGCYPTLTTQKDLRGIRGVGPDPSDPPGGCPYHPRCTQVIAECATWPLELLPVAGRGVGCVREGVVTRLAARGLAKTYRPSRREEVPAVQDVDLEVREGEVVGIVGETGSGKSTLARLLLGLTEPDAGTLTWEGHDTGAFTEGDWRAFRRAAAIVYQDPYEAVSHRLTVAGAVREPFDIQREGSAAERAERVEELLASVGLPPTPELLARHAHDLSGGQLQRVAIARALALSPRLLVADEPTSMLDASEQAKVLTLLKDLQVDRGMAMVFVSHDLALVRKVADRLVVLHAGEVAEVGPAHQVVAAPRSEVAGRLVRASPTLTLDLPDLGDDTGGASETRTSEPVQ